MNRSLGGMTLLTLLVLLGAPGCGSSSDEKSGGGGGGKNSLPTTPPSEVDKVTSDGFQDPLDTVVRHDGKEIYFSAFTLDTPRMPAIFSVPVSGGTPTPLASGDPLGLPIGLVLSCDNSTLYIADEAPNSADATNPDQGLIFTLSTGGGTPSVFGASGIGSPTGLALSVDCKTLYVTGTTTDGTPAVFTLPVGGGDATVLYSGAPLVSPGGVHVDKDNVAWVMDHLGVGNEGEGALFAIKPSGEISPVIGKVEGGVTMGVSLVAGGVTAVIPNRNDKGEGELITASTATGEITHLAAPGMIDPGGIRTARNAGVMAITDHDGSSIYIAK